MASMDCEEATIKKTEDPFALHQFFLPDVQVKSVADMEKWMKSQAYHDYLGFITSLNLAVKAKSLSANCEISPTVEKLLKLLDDVSQFIDETPPIEQPQRFGNKAFRMWHERLKEEAANLTKTVLPENLHRSAEEVSDYLVRGFGNETRIDYGTGHEASFAAFLCCLYKMRVLSPQDQIAIVNKVFHKYFCIARKLQKTYRMEPAGSQGVWGLDDFQFLPFIFGSSQLVMNPSIYPSQFIDPQIVSTYHKDYMFLECIKYINEVKTGPFAEHSSMLYSITSVPHWGKVNSGLIKMYKAEMLHKFPVIQHFRFGSILSFNSQS